ncbi:MAG: c-type cytochrome domain-containing protein [Maribacter sp.]|uniref:c-type cytochrome domain-containing protein n=1 Tax=Maribacter sp. TaxID=1897614 RepID=UPI003297B8D3
MANSNNSRWVNYVIFGLSIFLVFCLIFESYIALPNLVAWLGRWHPVVLHFPIVLLLLAIFLGLTGKTIPKTLLPLATIMALITAISGFFLGTDAGAKGDLLFWHQWLGGGTALLAVIWYWLHTSGLDRKTYTKILQVALAFLIGFTGHYGGMVTHGEEFLAFPTNKTMEAIPENPLIYQDVVARIIDESCVKCHSSNKRKGEFLMTNLSQLLKGGESGAAIVPGNYEESELVQRLHLPLSDENHMPPEGEKSLTDTEIQILERWIALGASDTLLLSHLDNNELLVSLVDELRQPTEQRTWAELPRVVDTTITRLNSDYVTIKRLASNLDALSVTMYMPPEYNSDLLISLQPIAENIIEMDVSGLPIGKNEMSLIVSCKNLEWLEIDRTPVTDIETDTLKVLSKLRTLKIYDTEIGDSTLSVIQHMENLKQIYLWKTKVSSAALQKLRTAKPALRINTGIDPERQALYAKKDSISEN